MHVVPCPVSLKMSTLPWCSSRTRRTIVRPRPLPVGRVVTNGSKSRSRMPCESPGPLSRMEHPYPDAVAVCCLIDDEEQVPAVRHRLQRILEDVSERHAEEMGVHQHRRNRWIDATVNPDAFGSARPRGGIERALRRRLR